MAGSAERRRAVCVTYATSLVASRIDARIDRLHESFARDGEARTRERGATLRRLKPRAESSRLEIAPFARRCSHLHDDERAKWPAEEKSQAVEPACFRYDTALPARGCRNFLD